MPALSISNTEGEFSVAWWDPEGDCYYEKRFCGAEEAVSAAISLVSLARHPAAVLGRIRRIIITDGWDYCIWEWKYQEGIVYPPELEGKLR